MKRGRINDGDRMFCVLMHRLFAEWKEHLVLVKPETVIRWQRQGFRFYWKGKSRPKGGRPAIAPDVIRLIRRECLDPIIPLGEGQLRRVLREYVAYYNESRCHMGLDGNAPEPREVERGDGSIVETPILGGLHHRYARTA